VKRTSYPGYGLSGFLITIPRSADKGQTSAMLMDVKKLLAEHLDVGGSDVLKAARNLKLEGIVSKRPSEPYVSGRTGIWTKAKCRARSTLLSVDGL
jgi:hypothetical protein